MKQESRSVRNLRSKVRAYAAYAQGKRLLLWLTFSEMCALIDSHRVNRLSRVVEQEWAAVTGRALDYAAAKVTKPSLGSTRIVRHRVYLFPVKLDARTDRLLGAAVIDRILAMHGLDSEGKAQ